MARSAAARQDEHPPGDGAEAADFAELRALIVGPEQRQLQAAAAELGLRYFPPAAPADVDWSAVPPRT